MADRHQQKPYPLRIPEELRQRLEQAAAAAGRSLNAEISKRLESSFSAIAADDVVAKAEGSDFVELIALQRMVSDAFEAQQKFLTNKIFDALNEAGMLEKYKSYDSDSWLKLTPPEPGQEFRDDLFSVEISTVRKHPDSDPEN